MSESSEKLQDFKFLTVLGEGNYGLVVSCHFFIVRHEPTGKFAAVKIQKKSTIVEKDDVYDTLNEKKVLQSLNFPFVVNLQYAIKNNSYVYFGMPFMNAQLLLAIEYIHKMGLVHRYLKPENVLIDYRGFVKITDFGFCKSIKDDRTYTTCGTPGER